MNNQRAKFNASLDFERCVRVFQLVPEPLPFGYLRLATARIFTQRNIKVLNQIFLTPLDEPGPYSEKCLLDSVRFSNEKPSRLKRS